MRLHYWDRPTSAPGTDLWPNTQRSRWADWDPRLSRRYWRPENGHLAEWQGPEDRAGGWNPAGKVSQSAVRRGGRWRWGSRKSRCRSKRPRTACHSTGCKRDPMGPVRGLPDPADG